MRKKFARCIINYRLTGFRVKWLSTWDSNWLGSRIYFRKSTGFRSITAHVWSFSKKMWEYEKHLKIPFDPYVLANNKPKPINTNTPRRLEWIYLRATYSAQEGHDILHLQTNSVVTKKCVKLAPIIPTIVYQVHYINER